MNDAEVPAVEQLASGADLPAFFAYLGMSVERAGRDAAVVKMHAPPGLLSPYGPVHGGAIAALIDTAIGVAVACHLAPGERTATQQLNLNYIAFSRSPVVIATARVIRMGRSVAHTQAEARSEDGVLVATALGTFGVLRHRG